MFEKLLRGQRLTGMKTDPEGSFNKVEETSKRSVYEVRNTRKVLRTGGGVCGR